MGFSSAQQVAIKLRIWNHGETPTVTDWEGDFHWDRISAVLEDKLADKEYASIVRTYYNTVFVPGGAESEVAEEIGLYYRAFTDPHRGRIIVGGASPEDVDNHLNNAKLRCAQRVFTAEELYALKPTYTDFEPSYSVLNYLTELNFWDFDHEACDATKRLEVRYLVHLNEWQLGTVWFDGKPFMVISCSGKDCENQDRWITDGAIYAEMMTWLHSFQEKLEVVGYIKASDILPGLTEFGGSTLHDFYDVELQEARKR